MRARYAYEPIGGGGSIFLAGPTPRGQSVPSWRPEALAVLGELGFGGEVYVPEPRDGRWTDDYAEQIDWEWAGLAAASCIVFWIPRDMASLPGLTTNVEWGMWAGSGKCVLGAPDQAEHVRYIRYMASRFGVPVFGDLRETLECAVKRAG